MINKIIGRLRLQLIKLANLGLLRMQLSIKSGRTHCKLIERESERFDVHCKMFNKTNG